MRERWLTNLALLAIALLLAGLIWLDQTLSARRARLTMLPVAAIERIVIEPAGAPAIRLERAAGIWRMLAPLTGEVDPVMVARLLGIAAAQVRRELSPSAAGLAGLGLAPPLWRLWLNDLELAIGGVEPIDGLRAVALGERVVLIDDRVLPQLQATPTAWLRPY